MRGRRIVITSPPLGIMRELIVPTGETWSPGMVVQIDPTVALKHGRNTGKIYDRDADGDRPLGAFWVVTEANLGLRGKGITDSVTFDSYSAGEQASVYSPVAGDELNLLFKNLSGTADDVIAGQILTVDDGTGKVQVTASTPETEIAAAKEALTDPTADTLIWCEWSGH